MESIQINPYHLLPFRFARIKGLDEVLLTSEGGEYLFVRRNILEDLIAHKIQKNQPEYSDLHARHILVEDGRSYQLDQIASQLASRKSYVFEPPSLHIFVVTLRCDHACHYCQVSRRNIDDEKFDMSEEAASAALDRVFESRAKDITVEFQGGEPLLNFERVRYVVEEAHQRNQEQQKKINFVIASTLHFLTDEILAFCRDYEIQLSTSLDGPEWLHNANRPNPCADSYSQTLRSIERARNVLGEDGVDALTTITKKSLSHPKEIVDEYIKLGFRSIFLRSLSDYGYARKTGSIIGYSTEEYLDFYEEAFDYIVEQNLNGVNLEEAYASLLLNNILTPFSSGYVNLRSPAGLGYGVLVYNYDGDVYASDEARMLKEMGDQTFRLGRVDQPIEELFLSKAMEIISSAGLAEALPGCSDCAFVPYCGSDPIDAYNQHGDPFAYRPSGSFCKIQTRLFEMLFLRLRAKNADELKVFLGWISNRSSCEIANAGSFSG